FGSGRSHRVGGCGAPAERRATAPHSTGRGQGGAARLSPVIDKRARRGSTAATHTHEGSWMVSSAEILAAFREVSNTKQLDRAELYALLQDGILAALAKKYGPTVQAEVDIDDGKGDIRIVLLKTVVAAI